MTNYSLKDKRDFLYELIRDYLEQVDYWCHRFETSRDSDLNTYENQIVDFIGNKPRTKAKIWLRHPQRRQYSGVTFDPTTTEHKNDLTPNPSKNIYRSKSSPFCRDNINC